MDPQDAIDLSREAIRTCIFVGGPILIACLLIGLLINVIQAVTQLHDSSISFVPKVLLLLLVIGLCLPWLSDQMMEFARTSFEKPMSHQGLMSQSNFDDPVGRGFLQPTSLKDSLVAPVANSGSARVANVSNRVQSSKILESTIRKASNPSVLAAQPDVENATQDPTDLSIPKVRTESPFLLPHYRYESKTRADPDFRMKPDPGT